MIEASDLTKRFGDKLAVDHLSFSVQPGRVTGFLGPNGAGKSTTMRHDPRPRPPERRHRPPSTAGPTPGWPAPLLTVGALLEAKSVHTGRSARNHLLFLAQTQGLPRQPGGRDARPGRPARGRGKRAGGFSLGMSQRLGVAAALLGDPQVLLLDEPVNGLDPEGVLWIRNLMKHLASQGKTVLVSSHLMNEMAVTADHLIVIGRGKLLADAATDEVIARGSGQSVRVRTPDPGPPDRADHRSGRPAVQAANGNGTGDAGTGDTASDARRC